MVTVILLVLALTGCGDPGATSGKAGPANGGTPATPSSPATSGHVRDNPAADPRALGIDTVAWPGDRRGAQSVFDRMPDVLAGLHVRRPHFYGPSTGVAYGPGDAGILAWVMGATEEVKDPEAALAVMFGMGMSCTRDSYVGTATRSRWGGGPDLGGKRAPRPDHALWWFSCRFEGEPQTSTGHAIGWVSGDLGWLVVTPDEGTTRLTIGALARSVRP